MPGAAAAAVRESRHQRRSDGGGGRRAAKRSSSSAANLQRNRPDTATTGGVVATGYTPVDADLPPVNAPINASKKHLNANESHSKTKNSTATRSSSDRQVRFLQKDESSYHDCNGISEHSPGSTTSSGVSSASSSPPIEKYRSSAKRSVSIAHRLSPEGKTSSRSVTSSSFSSPRGWLALDEDDVTCAICLDLLHRPHSLPCGHTFCLICLQNYANSCRTVITCPSCRGAAHVPNEGVMGLPPNTALAEMVQILKERRKDRSRLVCIICSATNDVLECGHCKQPFCKSCGVPHAKQVQTEVEELRQRLTTARDTLFCQAEENEVQEMKKSSQQQSESLSNDIEQVLESSTSHTNQPMKWEQLSQLHASLKRLLKATNNAKGPRITLDEVTLTLSGGVSPNLPPEEPEAKEEDEDDRHLTSQDHSLLYRRKGTLSRMHWGQHLGERPAGVAVNPLNSDIFVTGSDTCRVFVFDSSGRQTGSFGSRGHSDGQFLCPIGLAFSLVSNEVFITDKWKHCIHVFDTEGNFIRQLGRKGKGYGHFSSPEGIATDRQGRIYVADTCNHRVQILDGDGVFLKEVGVVSSETLGDGQRYTKSEFNEPTGVAASVDGSKVYVADAGNHRIKVFNGITGARELMFGSRGKHKGQFESPESIAVDPEGFMMIGDSGNGRVQVFRPNGNFIRFLGSRGHNHGEFGWVSGVALSKSLDVVVTDFKNNLVAVF